MKNWLFKYNPLYVFYKIWDSEQSEWRLGRMNVFKAIICKLSADPDMCFTFVSRKNIFFEE